MGTVIGTLCNWLSSLWSEILEIGSMLFDLIVKYFHLRISIRALSVVIVILTVPIVVLVAQIVYRIKLRREKKKCLKNN